MVGRALDRRRPSSDPSRTQVANRPMGMPGRPGWSRGLCTPHTLFGNRRVLPLSWPLELLISPPPRDLRGSDGGPREMQVCRQWGRGFHPCHPLSPPAFPQRRLTRQEGRTPLPRGDSTAHLRGLMRVHTRRRPRDSSRDSIPRQ